MTNILERYLGDYLFYITDIYEEDNKTRLLTLKELKGKIIIKTDSTINQIALLHENKAITMAKMKNSRGKSVNTTLGI